jgi:RsiW-degrading membrane proteinase PrsW (M82 family)
MSIVFQCECGQKLSAKDELAGRMIRCPACKNAITIPAPQAAPPRAEEGIYALEEPAAAAPLVATPARPARSAPEEPTLRKARAGSPSPEPDESASDAESEKTWSVGEYLYVVLVLALIPLVINVVMPTSTKMEDRLKAALEHASPETRARIEALRSQEGVGLDDLLAVLPGGKLDATAHLPRATAVHWIYGAVAAALFWIFTMFLFPGEKKTPIHLLLVGLFTGTIGIVLLLGFQLAASATQGVWLRGRSIVLILFYIVKFIGWSYASANDPNSNLFLSFVGFTCGVGLCEELCKALPLLGYYRRDAHMGWRGAAVWGLASGAGFGVAEGIMYSSRYYNGLSPLDIYIVRFVSCVALHAIWTAAVGITMWRRQETIQGDLEWGDYSLSILIILAVPMVLHGLYDTLLKKDFDLLALAVGVASFAWLAFQVERARADDGETRARKRKGTREAWA